MVQTKRHPIRTADIVTTLDSIVCPSLAQDWDNVGLLAGDRQAPCRSVLLCIDMTNAVLAEAVRREVSLVAAYHPPIFRPISRLLPDTGRQEDVVFGAIADGISVYAMHTALDAASGGTNDVLANLCQIVDRQPFDRASSDRREVKIVVFVPVDAADRVATAAFACGGGVIGDYTRCSFRSAGVGTFHGGDSTRPAVGRRGHSERVEEVRLEFVAPSDALAEITAAVRSAHPYEEPAVDVFALQPPPTDVGMGRAGQLARPTTLGKLAKRLAEATGANTVQVVGRPAARLKTAAVCAGAAGRVVLDSPVARQCDVVVTGEISHHEALAYQRTGIAAIGLGHWASERPVLPVVARKLRTAHRGLNVYVSRADRDPLAQP